MKRYGGWRTGRDIIKEISICIGHAIVGHAEADLNPPLPGSIFKWHTCKVCGAHVYKD